MWTFSSSRAIALSLLLTAVGCSAPSDSGSTSSGSTASSPVPSDTASADGDTSTAIVIDGSSNVRHLVQAVGYTALPEEAYAIAHQHLQDRKIGTVFGGQSRTDLTIEELLKEEAAF